MPLLPDTGFDPSYKLRNELFDDDNLTLELSNINFTVTNNTVLLELPTVFWEALRQNTPYKAEWIDASDEDITIYVLELVQQRQTLWSSPHIKNKALFDMGNSTVLGSNDTSMETQTQHGISHFISLREKQQFERDEIERIKLANK